MGVQGRGTEVRHNYWLCGYCSSFIRPRCPVIQEHQPFDLSHLERSSSTTSENIFHTVSAPHILSAWILILHAIGKHIASRKAMSPTISQHSNNHMSLVTCHPALFLLVSRHQWNLSKRHASWTGRGLIARSHVWPPRLWRRTTAQRTSIW